MENIQEQNHLVSPKQKINLSKISADPSFAISKKDKDVKNKLKSLRKQLQELQSLLYAQHQHKVLIVLQAMDTAGKDSTIRHVFKGVNPQGVRVPSFGVPTEEELDHDFLWRIHQQTPKKGQIVIFNRSHYEDVLVVRVHQLVPDKVWRKRYEHINHFEHLLVDEGTTILKFYLHISKDEQRRRLQERIDNPAKRWKFSLGDLEERKLWDQYRQAYQDVFLHTSTLKAPWYIIPGNNKLYRNLVIAQILVNTLQNLKMNYPQFSADIENVKIEK